MQTGGYTKAFKIGSNNSQHRILQHSNIHYHRRKNPDFTSLLTFLILLTVVSAHSYRSLALRNKLGLKLWIQWPRAAIFRSVNLKIIVIVEAGRGMRFDDSTTMIARTWHSQLWHCVVLRGTCSLRILCRSTDMFCKTALRWNKSVLSKALSMQWQQWHIGRFWWLSLLKGPLMNVETILSCWAANLQRISFVIHRRLLWYICNLFRHFRKKM